MNNDSSLLPRGAAELLVALMTPTPRGAMGVPVLLWGKPGAGKSTFLQGLHRPGFPVVTLIASIHDPTDFSGLPVLHDGRTHFAPPAWAEVFDEPKQGILFLDELTTAPPAVQAALLRLVLERKVGALELPPGVRVVAAANPPEIAASGWELSLPLANRFVHLKWELDGNTYLRALEEGFSTQLPVPEFSAEDHCARSQYWATVVANFLRRNPQMAYTDPADGEYAFASPRTWDYAIALMTACDLMGIAPGQGQPAGPGAEVFLNLVKGCVGTAASTAFVQHLRQLRLPDPEAVLLGKQQVPKKLREDELITLFNTMASILLRWQNNGHRTALLRATMRFLEAVHPPAREGRADCAYAAIRRLVREGLLHRSIMSGTSAERENVIALLKGLEEHYKDLIGYLEQK